MFAALVCGAEPHGTPVNKRLSGSALNPMLIIKGYALIPVSGYAGAEFGEFHNQKKVQDIPIYASKEDAEKAKDQLSHGTAKDLRITFVEVSTKDY